MTPIDKQIAILRKQSFKEPNNDYLLFMIYHLKKKKKDQNEQSLG